MNFRNTMIVNAVIALGFGVALLLVPGPLTSLYGLTIGAAGLLIAQLFGAALGGYGLLGWFVRNAVDPEIRRAVLLAFFITDTTSLIVALLGQLSGLMNALGWSIVGIYLLLALGWGYLWFLSTSASQ